MEDSELYQERRKKVRRFMIDVSYDNCNPLSEELVYNVGDVFEREDDLPFPNQKFKVIKISKNEYFNYEFVFVELIEM